MNQIGQGNGILSVASETKFNANIMPRYKLISNKSAVANMTTLVEDARNRGNQRNISKPLPRRLVTAG